MDHATAQRLFACMHRSDAMHHFDFHKKLVDLSSMQGIDSLLTRLEASEGATAEELVRELLGTQQQDCQLLGHMIDHADKTHLTRLIGKDGNPGGQSHRRGSMPIGTYEIPLRHALMTTLNETIGLDAKGELPIEYTVLIHFPVGRLSWFRAPTVDDEPFTNGLGLWK